MEWKLDKNRAICPQICEQVCLRIALGEFAPGEKLLSVREIRAEDGASLDLPFLSYCRISEYPLW